MHNGWWLVRAVCGFGLRWPGWLGVKPQAALNHHPPPVVNSQFEPKSKNQPTSLYQFELRGISAGRRFCAHAKAIMASAMREDAATPRKSFAVVFIILLLDVNKMLGHICTTIWLAIPNMRSVFCIICYSGVVFYSRYWWDGHCRRTLIDGCLYLALPWTLFFSSVSETCATLGLSNSVSKTK